MTDNQKGNMRLSWPSWERTIHSNTWTMYLGKLPGYIVPIPIPWISPVTPDVPTPQPEPVPPISNGRILYNDLSGIDNSTFGDLCWSAYNHLVTNLPNEMQLIESFAEKELEGQTLPDFKNRSEQSIYASSVCKEILPKFNNSIEGQRVLKVLTDFIETQLNEKPSSRYAAAVVFAAGAAIGAASYAFGKYLGSKMCK